MPVRSLRLPKPGHRWRRRGRELLTADARAACVLTGPSVIWCPPSPSAAGSSPPRPCPAPSRRPLVGRRPLPRSGASLSLSAPGPRSALIGFHGVVCWCHAARPLGASVYPQLSWAARQWPPSGGTRVCVPLPEGVFSRTPRSARRCPQPARESTVGDSAGRVGAGVCRA